MERIVSQLYFFKLSRLSRVRGHWPEADPVQMSCLRSFDSRKQMCACAAFQQIKLLKHVL